MRPFIASVAAASSILLGAIVNSAAADAAKPVTHTVTIEAVAFQPDTLTVKPGDTVVWVNKDPFPHTVTSKDGGFDSQSLQAGESWKYVVKGTGDFAYICTFHPTMKGILRVK